MLQLVLEVKDKFEGPHLGEGQETPRFGTGCCFSLRAILLPVSFHFNL
jgi:hypothetical protein